MKKEEILEMSRKENQKRDLVEIEVEKKGIKYASLGVIILATIYFCLEIIVTSKTNNGLYSVIALYCAMLFGYKGLKTKNKFQIICGIIWTLVTIILIVKYVQEIFAGAI